jgi:hypothetical protein
MMPTRNQLAISLNSGFDAIAYWSRFEFKKWTVELRTTTGRESLIKTIYVRARSRQGAERTARHNANIRSKFSVVARLATPRDLGCAPIGDAL